MRSRLHAQANPPTPLRFVVIPYYYLGRLTDAGLTAGLTKKVDLLVKKGDKF
jgi:hypothetical protein